MLRVFRRAWPYLLRYRRALVLGTGALLLKDLLGALLPVAIGAGVDALTHGFKLLIVVRFAALLVLLSSGKGLFMFWMRVILVSMSRDVEYDIRNDLYAHLVRLSPDFYSRWRTGDIMARATNDLNAVRMMLGPGIMYWTETMFTFLFAITIMVWVDWKLAIMALLPAPLVSLVVVYFGRRIHDRFERIQAMFSDISSRVQEMLAGVRVVRAYAQERAEAAEFARLNVDYIDENIRLAKLSALFNPLLQALISITFLMVLWVGGYQMLHHRITLGNFVMFNTFTGLLVWPMIALGWVVNLMQRGIASWDRIMSIIDEKPSIAAAGDTLSLPVHVRGEIRFDDIEVCHGAATVLEGISLTIRAGSTVAIVGHTGSGKSTLVSLIPRLLDPARGRVLVDGIDVRDLDPEALRRHIGFVPQETFLFSSTLAENIAFGAPESTREEIERAAELAGLAPDIASFPNGLDTIIGERGLTLSGGQKQRAAIARAVLRNPAILILDDALSSVDTLTEERILNGLAETMHDRTTILISHRVSTVRDADRIFVLEHGEIVEQGSHSDLVSRGGYYADLYQKQLLEEELEAI